TRQPAHVEPYETVELYAKASGYLKAIHVDIGDRVKAGQVLAELFIPELETQLQQKRAMVRQAEAGKGQAAAAVQVAQAGVAAAEAKRAEVRASIRRSEAERALGQSEYERTQSLVEQAAVTQSLLDEMRSKLRAAEAN